MSEPSVEIAGGGLAGLACAIAFAERGWRTRVWEQSPTLRELGAGLYVWENGLRTLEALGVYDELMPTSHPVHRFDVRDEWARTVESFKYSHEPGDRLTTMLRPLLHSALAQRATDLGAELVTGARAIAATPTGELTFEDGRTVKAELVVGADGLHSQIRDSVGLGRQKRILRDGATRMLIPRTAAERRDPETQRCIAYWSRTRRVLYTPCHHDWVYCAACARNDDTNARQVPLDPATRISPFPRR